jgi:hypothetical protein
VIAIAAIPGIRKQLILILIVTNPLVTALGFRQFTRFPTQLASRPGGLGLSLRFLCLRTLTFRHITSQSLIHFNFHPAFYHKPPFFDIKNPKKGFTP